MEERRRIVKKIFFSVFCLFAMQILFAQNGVSLDEFKKNPYFQNETSSQTEQNSENQEDTNAENKTKYRDPSSENFYNSSNWEATVDPDFSYPEFNASEENGTSDLKNQNQDEGSLYEWGDPLLTDAEKRGKFPWLPLNDSRFVTGIFYSPNYVLSLQEDDFASYFNLERFFNFELIGFGAKFDFLFAQTKNFALNTGLNLSFNYLQNTQSYYVLCGSQLLSNFVFGLNFLIGDYFLLNFHVNAGILSILSLDFEYLSGAKSESSVYFYPAVGGGLEFDFYLGRNFGLSLCGDFNWPFFIEKPYPLIPVRMGIFWRF